MNDKMTSHAHGVSDNTDATGNTHITDFTQAVSCAIGQNRHDRRRQRIREELVREYISQESVTFPASPSLRNRLRNLFKLN